MLTTAPRLFVVLLAMAAMAGASGCSWSHRPLTRSKLTELLHGEGRRPRSGSPRSSPCGRVLR